MTVRGSRAEHVLVEARRPEFSNDRLDVSTLGGSDTVSSSGLAPNTIHLLIT